jgi:hypothetical protein
MLRYIRHSDIAFRFNLSPFNWNWIPFFAKDAPTAFFPKRTTYAIGWLCIQFFIDIDDGTRDFKAYNDAFFAALDEMDTKDEDDVRGRLDDSVPGISSPDKLMVERS